MEEAEREKETLYGGITALGSWENSVPRGI
jgi:hypothetical protein